MKRLLLFGLILLLALAGCNGGGTGDDAANNTQPPTEAEAETDSESASAQTQSGERSFEVTITGDADRTIPPGSAQAEFYAETAHHELFFGDMATSVFFVLPEDLAAAEYELTARDPLEPYTGPAAEVTLAVDPTDVAMGTEDYDAEVSGTLTISEAGETVSGSFDLTATCACEDESDAEVLKTIEVTGTFSDLPVRENA